jgi:hypothetical protein
MRTSPLPPITWVASLAAAAMLLAAPAFGATVERHCTAMGSAYGPTARACVVTLRGEIVPGDAALVADSIRESPDHVEVAALDSLGGDPFEALKISDVLNRYFVVASTGSCSPGETCPASASGRCASACALLFIATNSRLGSEVYFHRPTFPAGYFSTLSGSEAEQAYNSSVTRLIAGLRQHRVPDPDIQRMMSISSETVEKLEAGYPIYSPWMAEWLLARCGAEVDPTSRLFCETDVELREQLRTQGKALPEWRSAYR